MSPQESYYYDLFLNNRWGALYRIKFKDGTTLTGVPTADSMPDLNDPTFFLELKNSKRPILFLLRNIKDAKKIE